LSPVPIWILLLFASSPSSITSISFSAFTCSQPKEGASTPYMPSALPMCKSHGPSLGLGSTVDGGVHYRARARACARARGDGPVPVLSPLRRLVPCQHVASDFITSSSLPQSAYAVSAALFNVYYACLSHPYPHGLSAGLMDRGRGDGRRIRHHLAPHGFF
jgi:hypothetical protein